MLSRSALIHFLGAIRTSSSETREWWRAQCNVPTGRGCVWRWRLLSESMPCSSAPRFAEHLVDSAGTAAGGLGWFCWLRVTLPHTFWWLYSGVAALATQGHDQLGLEKLQLFPKLWSLPWDQPFSKTTLALERQNLIDFQVQIQKGNDSCLFCSHSKDAASMSLRCQNY